MLKSGIALSLSAIILQIAVFLQPFLPKQYQVAAVCETISSALISPDHQHHGMHHHASTLPAPSQHHDASHQCPFCTVYNHLIPFLDLGVKFVFIRLTLKLLAVSTAFKLRLDVIEKLFVLPQSRAPPIFLCKSNFSNLIWVV